ncbi:MAG: cell division protein ZapA [Elusimicrobia bacterium]|nr:cell division protein ZapA [Elusimicrobiota bacterium]
MITSEVRLKIKKRDITMSVDGLTELEIGNIADQVEKKIDEIEKRTGQPDTSKLAVMAALEFAIELHNLKQRYSNNKEADTRKIDEMTAALEGALDKKLF